ncbi:hypothetical protein H8E77_38615 [bacterium]|nr:hypothetical protein [bacterium]
MANDTDVLLKFCEQYWEEMRHIENQRATITNIIIVITSAIIGFIAQKGISSNLLPLTTLLIILGIYGALTVTKLYERHQFGQVRLNHWYKRIDELNPNAQFLQLRSVADAEHKTQHPRTERLKLHYFWLALHITITLLGIVITVFIII